MRGPFDFEHADPWSSDVVDVESLNAQLSDAVLSRIEEVRRAAPLGPRELGSSTLLGLGPAGSGKTHLFVRVRRRLGPRAAFVLVRPEIGIEATPRHVLTQIVDSLQHPASGTTDRQLDVIAASMLAAVSGERVGPHVLIEQLRQRDERLREDLIERATAHLEALYPEVWTDYLERLLRAPFLPAPDRRAANAWLAGREMNDVQLSRLGGGASLTEADVLPALRTLAVVAAHGSPIVLVFDQLENLVTTEHQSSRIAAHGNLISELHDSVRGLVIVQLALDAEWDRNIRPKLAASHRSRVESKLFELSLPTPDQREELVRAWLGRLPEAERGEPFPWPFTPEQLQAWRRATVMTPRMLMIACREALQPSLAPAAARANEPAGGAEAPPSTSIEDRLSELWALHLARGRAELQDVASDGRGLDAERLASALMVAADLADLEPSTTTDRVTRIVTLQRPGRQLRIVQHAHPRSVAAALQHAAAAEDPARSVVVREHTLAFSPTWTKVDEYARELGARGVGWVWLAAEDATRLVALHDFLAAGRSQDLAGSDGRPLDFAVVERWVKQDLDWQSWPGVRSALFGLDREDASVEHEPVPPAPAPRPPTPKPPPGADSLRTPTLVVLRRLRVASVDRLLREVRHVDPGATATSVSHELAQAGSAVAWYGRRLCVFVEREP
ncbi:MAG: hypothetical protein HS104_06530 [Polyangiaceae bacterium]|nr:hypothetical protein [Polyangiaceae bacterium]MCE7890746.1 hypothetical protein [Sorangiineae bacterium PRO1]MCL4753121.1 hypothetical protein [Myxococcales bacterium]